MARQEKYTRGFIERLIEDYEAWKAQYRTFTAFVEAHGHNRSSIYQAMQRLGIASPVSPPPWGVHLQLQRREACPPEVYCARNQLSERTFRDWARRQGTPLRCTKPKAKRDWWLPLLAELPEKGTRAWCYAQSLPIHLVAQAYHRHRGASDDAMQRLHRRYLGDSAPQGDTRCLLWGWDDLIVLDDTVPPASAIDRTNPPTHLIGQGQHVTPITLPYAQQLLKEAA